MELGKGASIEMQEDVLCGQDTVRSSPEETWWARKCGGHSTKHTCRAGPGSKQGLPLDAAPPMFAVGLLL